MRRLILILFCAFSFLAAPAFAKDSRAQMWVVSQLSGDARVSRNGLQPASLKAKAQLAPGDVISTGATGRATLTRGADYIVMAPRSELRLPSTPEPTGFTRVMQNLGTMLFKVRHTGVPHFAVDTPMLAAVVKGTTFTVIVDKDRSAVQVTEGAVQVSASDGGMSRLVEGGRTVFIDHSRPKELIDADVRSKNRAATSSRAVKVSGTPMPTLAAIAGLTEGLVRPVATPAPTSSGSAVATPAVLTPVSTVTAPTVTTPGDTQPVVDIVDTTLPPVVEPVVDIVEGTLPPVVEPVVDIVEPVVDIVEPVVEIVEPVVEIVEPVVDMVEPVIEIVQPVVAPVVEVVTPVVQPVVQPVVNVLPGLGL